MDSVDMSALGGPVSDAICDAQRSIDAGADLHRVTAALLYSVTVKDVTDDMRHFGKLYNMAVYRAVCRFQSQS